MTNRTHTPLELQALRERLDAAQGKHYWRSLEELAEDDSFQELLEREFPRQASEWTNPITRRQFLVLMGASLALAGVSGCTRPPAEKILPYIRQPEGLVLGKPLFYATAMTLGGFATGLLVESHEGRPTKVEGNPDHPASLGATDSFAQASILTLYDPDRSRILRDQLGHLRTWDDALNDPKQGIRTALAKQADKKGAGLRILTETVTSPTLFRQLQALRKAYPEAKWVQYDPVGRDNVRDGARLAFGENVNTYYRLALANVILTLDADILGCGNGHLRYVRDFSDGRRVWREERPERAKMNRLYAVEATPTLTGAAADHRLALRPGQVENLARAIAAGLGVKGVSEPTAKPFGKWKLDALVKDLRDNRGTCVVVAGDGQPPIVHALAHAMNAVLGNVGQTVIYTDPVESQPADQLRELAALTQDMKNGAVDVLLILGGNPVFTAPADLEFEKHLLNVPLRVHLNPYDDETSQFCHWHLPETHYLEAWSDARAYDGTATIVQPLIAPLYQGLRSAHEFLAALLDPTERPGHEIVRETWRNHWEKAGRRGDFEQFWQRSLHDGIVAGTALLHRTNLSLRAGWEEELGRQKAAQELDVVFRPDPTLHDGRFANNAWLQELPKPLTQLTWDNAAFVSINTAKKYDLALPKPGPHGGEHGEAFVDVVKLQYRGREVEAPVWVLPGHPDDCVTVHFGYGRTKAGKVGNNTGFNAYRIRTSAAPWFDTGLKIVKTDKRYTLACTQQHYNMENRHLIRSATLERYQEKPNFAADSEQEPGAEPARSDHPRHGERENKGRRSLSMFPAYEYPRYKWGMAIDLTACTGCGACVVACQAENNIPVVGKDQVTRGREMHWLRVDRFYEGDPVNAPEGLHTHFQPVPCMHCENAPCELVCPVEATVHSADGLNDMVYNRCVGTRYCSNNCPYKVRRFNFLAYSDYATESLKLLRNPEVTVRSRGVMEKCTYCVQRIRNAEIDAEKRGYQPGATERERRVLDGEVVTACQQACPARAIVFGDINGVDRDGDPSQVRRMKDRGLNYALFADLNTVPRTTYLAAVRNPNPELEEVEHGPAGPSGRP